MQMEEMLEERIIDLLKKENKALSAFEIEELLDIKHEELLENYRIIKKALLDN